MTGELRVLLVYKRPVGFGISHNWIFKEPLLLNSSAFRQTYALTEKSPSETHRRTFQLHPGHDTDTPYGISTEKMPFWPFSISPPEDKEKELPWHSAIIPYLQVKEVLHTVVILPDPEFRRYQDPPGTTFMTQFTRLKLFLDTKLIDESCRAWKELQETDPGFRKIQILHETSDAYRKEATDIPNEEGPVTFPEEWKDEDFFLNWLYVNVLLHLKCLSLDTLERATQVIMNTNHRAEWCRCGKEHKARLAREEHWAAMEAQNEKDKAQMKADWEEMKKAVKNEVKAFFLEWKREKMAKGLEKARKRQEVKRSNEARQTVELSIDIQFLD